jgi:hypothetical protein
LRISVGAVGVKGPLAGLAPEQAAVLALSDEVLRALSDDLIEKLPEPVRTTIRRCLGR